MKQTSSGNSLSRVDGAQKVTGGAKYFADHKLPGMQYGVLVCSTISSGTIRNIITDKALKAPGVVAVVSHLNTPPLPGFKNNKDKYGLRIFNDDRIYAGGQPVAIVIADTFERATYGASLVKVEYNEETHYTSLEKNLDKAFSPNGNKGYVRGEADAWKQAPVSVSEKYTIPLEIHNPMELAGVIAHWTSMDTVTLYAKTQGVKSVQETLAGVFGLPANNFTVHSQFVGGAFGMGLRVWPLEIAAIIAARKIRKPVKLVVTRKQMFTLVGYRPASLQQISIGATNDGKLTGITHEATGNTSAYENFTEGIVAMSHFMYACPNVNTRYQLVPLNLSTPIWMRGPGEATGSFALESAMDELAYKLNLDPLELRIRNHADTDPERNLPFSSKYLKEAYEVGAEKIGWHQRNPAAGSMKENGMLVGYGMSSGAFGAYRANATVDATLKANGRLLLQNAASDIGPGTGTAMVLIAAKTTGLATDNIEFKLGDSSFPYAPKQGGSLTISTVGSAVSDACNALKEEISKTAIKSHPAFRQYAVADLQHSDGKLMVNGKPESGITYQKLLADIQLPEIKVSVSSKAGEDAKKYSMYSFSVHFAKIHVHPLTGVVSIQQVVSVADAGSIVNMKTARSQMIGGVTGGIGMALTEEGLVDHRFGKYVNNNYADYHVPVNADTPPIDVYFINKKDPVINPMGAKGMGEIALIGFAAAVANAVYHATGKRIRELPITPDKILLA
jgi:xanthine dehydrogenase YagR molybdenum-binding subunit